MRRQHLLLTSVTSALLFVSAGLASAGIYTDAVLSDSPVGYWRLGETTGTTAYDSAGSSYDGTYLNGVVQGVAGAIHSDSDTAASFDGSNDKIDIAYTADLNPSTYSFEIWANVASGTDSNHRSPMTSRANSPQQGYIFYAQGGQWQYWSGPGWQSIVAPSGSVVQGEWAHLVGTYDATTQVKNLYVNGLLAATSTGVTANPNTSEVLRIGGGATEGAGAYFFRGSLDEAAVYNSVLTSEQIRHHYVAAQGDFLNFHDFSNPGGTGLGADASAMTFAGATNASPTPTNPNGMLVLGGSGTGGLVFTQDLPHDLTFTQPLVLETEAFYLNGDAPSSDSNAYFGLKALHLMNTGDTGTDRLGGLFAQFQPLTTGSGIMRLGFQSANVSGTSLWSTPGSLIDTVSGFSDANGLFLLQLSIAGLDDDDELLFTVSQGTWSDQIATTIGNYRNALTGDYQATFDRVLAELRANPWSMDYGLISTSSRADAYNYVAIYGVVPEPSTLAMLAGLGAFGLIGYLRRRRAS